jgi:hypothetical protein
MQKIENLACQEKHDRLLCSHKNLMDDHICKENGPRAIRLKRFWCLMINITCGLISLLV